MAHTVARWLYRGGHPNGIAKALNDASAWVYSRGIAPDYLVTMEVPGWRTGRLLRLPLVMAVVDHERYLVSMLGERSDWVLNVRAAGGHVVLHHGRHERVLLDEVPVNERAPIVKAYLLRAPGARAHVVVDKDAPLSAFEAIAPSIPVFRVRPDVTPCT
jgi:hypothetical protein